MKILLIITIGAAVFGFEEYYLSTKYYEKGFEAASHQYMKMLAKEGYAFFNPKSGEWQLYPQVVRDNNDLDTYVYSLETELSLVKAQMDAQSVERKKNKK